MKCYQASDFKDRDFQPTAPFLLELDPRSSAEPWCCDGILRALPGKRWVLALHRTDETAVCKLLFRARDYQREIRGHRLLLAAGLETPAILDQGVIPSAGGHCILYQFIASHNLEQINAIEPLTATSAALLQTVTTTAAMHRAGLRQVDIHPGNFLYREGRIIIVDTAAVAQHRPPLRGKLALENLADLLAQFDPGQIQACDGLRQAYLEAHGTPGWDLAQLDQAVARMRRLRWRHYRGKLRRTCSEFAVSKNFAQFTIWARREESKALTHLLADPDGAMDAGAYLKQGNTATVARSSLQDRDIVIKRYNIKNWRHRLNRSLRPSRGWHSWHNAHYLLFNGLPTPRPIALQEERCGPLRGRAYLLTEFAPGTDLKTALEQGDSRDRDQLMRQFANILNGYHAADISHGDMKADNFIVTASGVTIIDLDSMKYHRSARTLNRALTRDIKRFLANFSQGDAEAVARHLLPLLPEQLRP